MGTILLARACSVPVGWRSGCRLATALVATKNYIFVKLYFDLRILTQLQLVGVGVDFVFPLEEGRKEEEEEGTHT